MKIKLPKKFTQGFMNSIFYLLIGILVAAIFYYIILSFVLSTDLPVVIVISNSMKHDVSITTDYYQWLEKYLGYNETYIDSWPVRNGFSVGDMPIIRGVEEYKVGDVIVYSVSYLKDPIIHRIIKINDDNTYQTKGDNNPGQNPHEYLVKNEQIHGKVLFIIPKLGYLKVIINKLIGDIK
jgi:hypothetical protein